MELVANVWPVMDEGTGMVSRFLTRAYAVELDDAGISELLKTLAPTDFLMARVFKLPETVKTASEHGTQEGVVPISMFHEHLQEILETAYRTLEEDYAKIQGVDVSSGEPKPVVVRPRFPQEPFTATTVLIETEDGTLIPQVTS